MSKEEGFTSPNTGDTRPIEAPTDQWGETHQDLDRYPEGSAARSGESTVPSGQGGATPHDGTSYQDKGEVLTYDEPHVLSVTHYSPMMGQPDEPESYHTLVYTLTPDGDATRLELTQDGNESEEQAEQFSQNWQGMLDGLKARVEG